MEQKCTNATVLALSVSFVCYGACLLSETLHMERTHVSHLGNKSHSMGSETPKISSYRREKNALFLFSSWKSSKDQDIMEIDSWYYSTDECNWCYIFSTKHCACDSRCIKLLQRNCFQRVLLYLTLSNASVSA